MSPSSRDEMLTCDDAKLLARCAADTYRASGPGGQKRNKTSSAVRLRHEPTGLIVIAEESRSQHENKARALNRLRLAIATSLRAEPSGGGLPDWLAGCVDRTGRITASQRHPEYPRLVALVLDVFQDNGGQVRPTAAVLGVSASTLGRFLMRDKKVLAAADRIRHEGGLRPLR